MSNNIDRSGRLQPSRRTWRQRQEFVVGRLLENKGKGTYQSMGQIMVEAGYPPATARNPQQLTRSKTFQDLLAEKMPDDMLQDTHLKLLASKKLDHMVFPLGPKDADDPNFSGAKPNAPSVVEKAGVPIERTTLTDQEIKELIKEVGGTVRRIVHGDTARHVYFWASNDKVRHDALKLAYDLKGMIGKKGDDAPQNTTYNTFIQQNNIDPNTKSARDVVDMTLEGLMNGTKRK